MSDFRKKIYKLLKENGFVDTSNSDLIKTYIDQLNEQGSVNISDPKERAALFDYCYNHYEELPFDPDDLRVEDEYIWLS